MKNPWDATVESIYNPHDDPIAVEADAEANERDGYHASIEAEGAYYMAEEVAAIKAEAKYYADVIWPKVKVVRDIVTNAKGQKSTWRKQKHDSYGRKQKLKTSV